MTNATPRRHLCRGDGGADEQEDRQEPPDAAQAHARIVEALRDPFALAVALLGSEAVRMPPPPAEEEPRQRPPRPRKQSRRTAADILTPRPNAPRW